MGIKRIIREELEAVLDSFYLLVSEDEKFIYTRGHLGGYRWESVNGLDPKEIMNSGFKEYSEPEGMISRMKREEISRGEETPNYLKPKIVPVDFILRKRDESFPIMESNELDWIKDIQPFSSGEHFNEDSICFRAYSTDIMLRNCEVLIDDKNINFTVSIEKFAEEFWKDGPYDSWEDESWILEPLMSMGTPYDGNSDYYDIESEEFEYSYNSLIESDRERFSDIINTINGTEVDFSLFEDNMLSIAEYLKYQPMSSLFDTLINDYVRHLGYAVQKNKWLYISSVWDGRVERSRAEWSMQGDLIIISIPLIEAEKLYGGTGVTNLSDLLKKIVSPISELEWPDWFNENWDSEGAEYGIGESFDTFLGDAESYIESENFERDKEEYKTIFDLGFVVKNSNDQHYYRKTNDDGTFWDLRQYFYPRHNPRNTITLKLFKDDTRDIWRTDPIKQHTIPLRDILDYVKP